MPLEVKHLNEYQAHIVDTVTYKEKLVLPVLAINGHAGRLARLIQKQAQTENGQITNELTDDIKDTLGELMRYIAVLSRDCESSIQDIANQNLLKHGVQS